ncbi:hypothetical protein ACFQMM_16735 [Saliphagus sp. GCM10025308]
MRSSAPVGSTASSRSRSRPRRDGLIFQIHTRNMNVADDVDFAQLAAETPEASGADVKAICTEAGMFAIRDDRTEIRMKDFYDAWEKVQAESTEDPEVSKTFA